MARPDTPSPRRPPSPAGGPPTGGAGVALVTGGSLGLGRALVAGLLADGWSVVTDARRPGPLADAVAELHERFGPTTAHRLVAVAGDAGDSAHRRELLAAVDRLGPLDLLVLNAGDLGPSPLPHLADLHPQDLAAVLAANVVAPHALVHDALGRLRDARGTVVAITSDAAAEAYEGWGGYGASKAALEHLARVLAEEEPALAVHRVDPGDLRTAMHQAAFPGEDISDRADPASAVGPILRLVHDRPDSGGRWQAQVLARPEPDGARA